jgi:hypothetical protein
MVARATVQRVFHKLKENTMMIRNLAAALACLSIGAAHALSAQEVSKVGDFTGSAVDVNNAGQVLLRMGSTGFTVINPVTGASQSFSLDANLKAQGYTALTANDLNNVGQVTGYLNDLTPFLWSASKGLQVLPVGHGGRFVNDAGTTAGDNGIWSEAAGTVKMGGGNRVSALNNLGQAAFVNSWTPNPGFPGGSAYVMVYSPSGQSLFFRSYSLDGLYGPDPSSPQLVPGRALLNDQGQLAISYGARKSYFSTTDFYGNLSEQPVTVAPAADALNNRGDMIGHPNNNSLGIDIGPYLFNATEPSVSLLGVMGSSEASMLTDTGWILQPMGTSYSLYRHVPSPAPLPAGTGAGLLGQYSNTGLFGSKVVLSRVENPFFDWAKGRPGTGVNTDFFSVKWSGQLEAEEAGVYRLRTVSDEGVRVTVDGKVVIDNWRAHKEATNDSADLSFDRASRHTILVEYFELLGNAKLQLSWQKPGASTFEPVPTLRLYRP